MKASAAASDRDLPDTWIDQLLARSLARLRTNCITVTQFQDTTEPEYAPLSRGDSCV